MSAAFPDEKKHLSVKGRPIAVVDRGGGDPIVFLAGAPSSSLLRRELWPAGIGGAA